MLKLIIGILTGLGLSFILSDAFGVPYFKTTRAVESLSKRQRDKSSVLDTWLGGLAELLSKHLRINEFKRAQLEADLRSAQMDITPEKYLANAIVKAGIVGVLALPLAFVMPVVSVLVLILAVVLYRAEVRSVSKRIGIKREAIEYELPRLVSNIEKTLAHNRDVVNMLESYALNAGAELKNELDITTADMKSGNHEGAITRMESRVGSSMMSDVCRGLIGIERGDDNRMYWASLNLKFSDTARQQLRLKAQKVPRKVKRLSMCLLICFMLIYVAVILEQIISSLGVLFG